MPSIYMIKAPCTAMLPPLPPSPPPPPNPPGCLVYSGLCHGAQRQGPVCCNFSMCAFRQKLTAYAGCMMDAQQALMKCYACTVLPVAHLHMSCLIVRRKSSCFRTVGLRQASLTGADVAVYLLCAADAGIHERARLQEHRRLQGS